MKTIKISIGIILLLAMTTSVWAQMTSPNQMINKLKKDDSAFAFTIPGWFIRLGGRIAVNDLDSDEKEIVKELTSHIKKLRFVVAKGSPAEFKTELKGLQNYFNKEKYESLITVKDAKNAQVNMWAKFEENTIKNLVISVLNEEDKSVFLNIKSDLDFDKLKEMDFFKEWTSEMNGL